MSIFLIMILVSIQYLLYNQSYGYRERMLKEVFSAKSYKEMNLGAHYKDNQCRFCVWAPPAQTMSVKLLAKPERLIPMQKDDKGYWSAAIDDVPPGSLYCYHLDGERERPDPASFFQPDGVHKPSQIIDHSDFNWQDNGWRGIPLSQMIMYELHIGTFTASGTFDAAIFRINDLKELGINAIEIMPVAQFPGERNWGYDGVYPFAVQNSYGGPEGLKMFVNECHRQGIAVILDVVYNHLGPEGNYLWDFGPYFTDNYKTPWGQAINFDGPFSNDVREYFIENALYWLREFHIDALRLDAIHGIYDISAKPFLSHLSERVEQLSEEHGRKYYLIAESDLNDAFAAKPSLSGGYGLDSLWCDDFHHSVHSLLTGESNGYYVDFGTVNHLATSLNEGFVYSGQYSLFRKKNHGNSSADLPLDRLVVFSQNHDQVGNRLRGERLSGLVSFEALKLTAGSVILSPYVPLLFMGEEYGETAPFLYFVSHSDPRLIEGVRQGRRKEFETLDWFEEFPDPQSADTLVRSTIQWEKRDQGGNATMLNLYRELIRLRKTLPPLSHPDRKCLSIRSVTNKQLIVLERWKDSSHTLMILNFNKSDITIGDLAGGEKWEKVLDSADENWDGPGSSLPPSIAVDAEVLVRAESFALYRNQH
jgi:maltooligosyltrehalose trehalohydrolase